MHDAQAEAERWLRQARTDLDAARTLRKDFPALACFHAQQSAEKALKAVLYAAGERPVLGHAVSELAARVVEHHPSFEELRSRISKLDRYYIPTRYPNGLPEGGDPAESFDAADATSAIKDADDALTQATTCVRAGREPTDNGGPDADEVR